MRYIKLIILLLAALGGYAQQLQFSNISVNMPLPAQECYNIMQDSKGYIWFSTEAGLCKYNGNSLTIFDKQNTLPEGSTYAVIEDTKQMLWYATSKNRILNYTNGKLTEASFSEKYQNLLKGSLDLSYLLNFDTDGALYINTSSKTFKVNTTNNSIDELFKADTSAHFYLLKTPVGLIPINGGVGQNLNASRKKANQGYIKIVIDYKNKKSEIRVPFDKNKYPYWRILTAHCPTADFFSFEHCVVKLNANGSYELYEYNDKIQQIYCDKNNGLWVGVRKNGVHYYPNIANMQNKLINLPEYSVTGICEDNEKGIWCTTLEKGIFYCKNKNVINYANIVGLNKRAHLLKHVDSTVYAATQDNELLMINEKGIKRQLLPDKEIYMVADVLKIENNWLVGAKTKLYTTNKDFAPITSIKLAGTQFNAGAYEIAITDSNRIFVVQHSVISELIKDEAIKRTPDGLESAGQCLLYIGNNKLLCGCKANLYEMNITDYSLKKIENFDKEVTKIIKTKRGEVLVVTKSEGLYEYKDGKTKNISTDVKLTNVRMFDIAEDKFETIWLATNAGLVAIKKDLTANKYTLVNTYTTLDGLQSNEIYKLAANNEQLYLSTNEGICSFSLQTNLKNENRPVIYLRSLQVNEKLVDAKIPLLLAYNENNLQLDFDILTFKSTPKLAYYFNGMSGTPEILEGNRLQLNNLDDGVYELLVYAINSSNIKSEQPVIIKFEILKPFWETSWFIITCVLLAGCLIFLLVRIIVKRIRHKEEEKTEINKLIAESQLTALQAQMNPHFIFNAINSIQRYILQNNQQEAYDYLAKFSRLIRLVLNNSQEKVLSLKQELDIICLYVELEQLRFDSKFEFTISKTDGVNEDVLNVPCLLIQPYVENAIWHGLMNLDKNKKGKLSIDLILQGELLKITIEDNGVGRELAKSYKAENGEKAMGMKLTEQRLQMINKLQDYENAKVLISDLHDEAGEATGTRVEILLPIN